MRRCQNLENVAGSGSEGTAACIGERHAQITGQIGFPHDIDRVVIDPSRVTAQIDCDLAAGLMVEVALHGNAAGRINRRAHDRGESRSHRGSCNMRVIERRTCAPPVEAKLDWIGRRLRRDRTFKLQAIRRAERRRIHVCLSYLLTGCEAAHCRKQCVARGRGTALAPQRNADTIWDHCHAGDRLHRKCQVVVAIECRLLTGTCGEASHIEFVAGIADRAGGKARAVVEPRGKRDA